jgi:hypothetical protein
MDGSGAVKQKPFLFTGQRWRPTSDIRINDREILETESVGEIKYRSMLGSDVLLIRTCSVQAFERWIKRWKAILLFTNTQAPEL